MGDVYGALLMGLIALALLVWGLRKNALEVRVQKPCPVEPCTHEVLTLSAPIAMRCSECGLLRPYEPEPTPEWLVGQEIVLGEHGAYTRPKQP